MRPWQLITEQDIKDRLTLVNGQLFFKGGKTPISAGRIAFRKDGEKLLIQRKRCMDVLKGITDQCPAGCTNGTLWTHGPTYCPECNNLPRCKPRSAGETK